MSMHTHHYTITCDLGHGEVERGRGGASTGAVPTLQRLLRHAPTSRPHTPSRAQAGQARTGMWVLYALIVYMCDACARV